jgi:hypothetical protein
MTKMQAINNFRQESNIRESMETNPTSFSPFLRFFEKYDKDISLLFFYECIL